MHAGRSRQDAATPGTTSGSNITAKMIIKLPNLDINIYRYGLRGPSNCYKKINHLPVVVFFLFFNFLVNVRAHKFMRVLNFTGNDCEGTHIANVFSGTRGIFILE